MTSQGDSANVWPNLVYNPKPNQESSPEDLILLTSTGITHKEKESPTNCKGYCFWERVVCLRHRLVREKQLRSTLLRREARHREVTVSLSPLLCTVQSQWPLSVPQIFQTCFTLELLLQGTHQASLSHCFLENLCLSLVCSLCDWQLPHLINII